MDKITQLQSQLSLMTSIIVDSVGILQSRTPPVPIADNVPMTAQRTDQDFSDIGTAKQEAVNYGKKFVQTCVEFERLLDELPNINSKNQIEQLVQLNQDNINRATEVSSLVDEAQTLLDKISGTLREVSDHHFHKSLPMNNEEQDLISNKDS